MAIAPVARRGMSSFDLSGSFEVCYARLRRRGAWRSRRSAAQPTLYSLTHLDFVILF